MNIFSLKSTILVVGIISSMALQAMNGREQYVSHDAAEALAIETRVDNANRRLRALDARIKMAPGRILVGAELDLQETLKALFVEMVNLKNEWCRTYYAGFSAQRTFAQAFRMAIDVLYILTSRCICMQDAQGNDLSHQYDCYFKDKFFENAFTAIKKHINSDVDVAKEFADLRLSNTY